MATYQSLVLTPKLADEREITRAYHNHNTDTVQNGLEPRLWGDIIYHRVDSLPYTLERHH